MERLPPRLGENLHVPCHTPVTSAGEDDADCSGAPDVAQADMKKMSKPIAGKTKRLIRDFLSARVDFADPTDAYSITSSALARSGRGTVSPRARAVRILMTNSNLIGRSTGISPGRVPFRTRSG